MKRFTDPEASAAIHAALAWATAELAAATEPQRVSALTQEQERLSDMVARIERAAEPLRRPW